MKLAIMDEDVVIGRGGMEDEEGNLENQNEWQTEKEKTVDLSDRGG